MRRGPTVLSAVILMLLLNVSFAADKQRFDGNWQTTVSCEGSRGALGFSYRFMSAVKDGVFHGVHGTESQPGSLVIDGTISPDGKASLYAKGRTGSKEFVAGRDTPPGTDFGYNINAQFEGATGSGTRIEGRPCILKFEKQ